jgi:hypothetical protein
MYLGLVTIFENYGAIESRMAQERNIVFSIGDLVGFGADPDPISKDRPDPDPFMKIFPFSNKLIPVQTW